MYTIGNPKWYDTIIFNWNKLIVTRWDWEKEYEYLLRIFWYYNGNLRLAAVNQVIRQVVIHI